MILLIILFFITNIAIASDKISRDKIIENAKEFADYTWTVKSGNADPYWNSRYVGQYVKGLAYNWGGFDTIERFEDRINEGRVAGNDLKTIHESQYIRTDFAGVDCSGFVSLVWETPTYTGQTSKYGTSTLPYISYSIGWDELEAGDILLKSGHVRVFEKYNSDGTMMVYESTTSGSIDGVTYRALSRNDDYTPSRYDHVEETPVEPEPDLLADPLVTYLYPNPVTPMYSGERQWIYLYGYNFTPNSRLEFEMVGYSTYSDRVPVYISPNWLAYYISVGSSEKDWTVKVINEEGDVSNTFAFRVAY